ARLRVSVARSFRFGLVPIGLGAVGDKNGPDVSRWGGSKLAVVRLDIVMRGGRGDASRGFPFPCRHRQSSQLLALIILIIRNRSDLSWKAGPSERGSAT